MCGNVQISMIRQGRTCQHILRLPSLWNSERWHCLACELKSVYSTHNHDFSLADLCVWTYTDLNHSCDTLWNTIKNAFGVWSLFDPSTNPTFLQCGIYCYIVMSNAHISVISKLTVSHTGMSCFNKMQGLWKRVAVWEAEIIIMWGHGGSANWLNKQTSKSQLLSGKKKSSSCSVCRHLLRAKWMWCNDSSIVVLLLTQDEVLQ